ncbi:MAG TPA: alpha/beta hydrolase-fold protein, partial [Savagea sp.]
VGAGFYLDATQAPWSKHYRMFDYVSRELPDLIEAQFPATKARAISGQSTCSSTSGFRILSIIKNHFTL